MFGRVKSIVSEEMFFNLFYPEGSPKASKEMNSMFIVLLEMLTLHLTYFILITEISKYLVALPKHNW